MAHRYFLTDEQRLVIDDLALESTTTRRTTEEAAEFVRAALVHIPAPWAKTQARSADLTRRVADALRRQVAAGRVRQAAKSGRQMTWERAWQ